MALPNGFITTTIFQPPTHSRVYVSFSGRWGTTTELDLLRLETWQHLCVILRPITFGIFRKLQGDYHSRNINTQICQIWRCPKSSGYLQIIISHVAEDPLTRLQVKAIVPQATDLPETRIGSFAQNIRWKIRWSTEIYCQEKTWYEFAHPTCIMNKTLLFLWTYESLAILYLQLLHWLCQLSYLLKTFKNLLDVFK